MCQQSELGVHTKANGIQVGTVYLIVLYVCHVMSYEFLLQHFYITTEY